MSATDAALTPAPPADCQGHHVGRAGERVSVPACPIEFLEQRPHHETRVLRLCLGCAVARAKGGES